MNSIIFTVLNICWWDSKEHWLQYFGVVSLNLNLIGIFAGICFGCKIGKVILMSIGISYGTIDSIFRIC
jgi:hypothetical protein